MSNNIQNENELWDKLNQPTTEPPKAEAPKTPKAPRSAKTPSPAKAKPARKLDGFFYGCMAGVAAVSVAVTLLLSSMLGGNDAPPTAGGDVSGNPGSSVSEDYEALARENEALQSQLELQKEQIKKLQDDLMTLMGTEEYLSQIATDPTGGNDVLDSQIAALDLLAQIQEAHANSDTAKLEELIPQMDEMLSYLPSTALNDYYLILEYMEQPSNNN